MQLSPGHRIGPYQIVSVLGTGGMGEVYRARDTRLGRDIALKMVSPGLTPSPDLVGRFEQEARLAGSLNHPNLLAVYDVGEHEGVPYLITELLEGESLRSRLAQGRVPLQTALEWGAQMARGLAAAHARGIVHRDVKPDNVFVAADGRVKLLDFGIAKLVQAAGEPRQHGLLEETVTPTGSRTRPGEVLGTPGYMSPEQVRGEALDVRSDVFSLGAVLYELLGGSRAFGGQTLVESGYAVLHQDPPPLPPEVPAAVAQTVLRCLEKQPVQRFQSASDLAFALEVLRAPTSTRQTALPTLGMRARPRWPLVAVLAAGLLAAAAIAWRARPAPARPALPRVEQVTHRWGTINRARFAADGRILFSAAFEGGPEEIYGRPPGSPEAQALGLRDMQLSAVSRSGELALLKWPRFSLIFTRQGTLARVASVGGIPRDVAEQVEYADWSPGGELAIVTGGTAGRSLEFPVGKLLFHTAGWISDVRFSRRGDRIAFVHHPVFGDDMGEVMLLGLDGSARVLGHRTPRMLGLAWAPDDAEIWFTAGDVQRNILRAVDLAGRQRDVYAAPSDIQLHDIESDGSVLLVNQFDRSEVTLERDGKQTLISWDDWTNAVVGLSRDRKVLFSVTDPRPVEEGAQDSLVVLRGDDGAPAQILGNGIADDLSSDGRWALVHSNDGRTLRALPTGAGQPRTFRLDGMEVNTARWLPGGNQLVIEGRTTADPHNRVYLLDADAGAPRPVSSTPVALRRVLYASPDGKRVATLDQGLQLILISLVDGSASRVPGLPPDAIPRGWAENDQLWVTVGGDRAPARSPLLRVELPGGRVLAQRSIGPVDPTGSGGIGYALVSPDGRDLAMMFGRSLGQLYVMRGLSR